MNRNPLFRDFLTGAFALAAVTGLCLLLVLMGEWTNLLQKNYSFTVVVTNGMGIGQTSPVTLNGVKIGQVTDAAVRKAPGVGAVITVEVREEVRIPRRASVGVDKGFVGDAVLEFIVPQGLSPEAMNDVIEPGEVFDGGSPKTLMQSITAALQEPLDRFAKTGESIEKLAQTYTDVGERIKEMLEPRTLAEVDAGKPANVRTAIQRLDAALASANAWLGDESLKSRAGALIDRADATMTEFAALADAWKSTASRVDATTAAIEGSAKDASAKFADLAAQGVSALKRAENAADALTQTLELATKGQGTAAQLLNNPDLYNALRSDAERLDQVLLEIQLMIAKYKAEGIPIKF